MKKLISLLLAGCMVVLCASCGSAPMKDPGNVYYPPVQNHEDDMLDPVFRPEVRDLDGLREDPGQLIRLCLQGPRDKNLYSPFPRGSALVDYTISERALIVTMNAEFAQLSGVELTVACACLAKTVLEATSLRRVYFQAENSMLNGEQNLAFSQQNMQFTDDSLEKLHTTYSLFYADTSRRYLIEKEVAVRMLDEVKIAEFLVSQLCINPKEKELLSPIPEGARLLDVTVADKICRVNFSSEFDSRGWRNAEAQRLTLLSIVNTLTQLSGIDAVEFYSEGNLLTQYRSLHITGPMTRDDRAVGPVRTGLDEFDASLYLVNGNNTRLACVPVRVRSIAGISQAELTAKELVRYAAQNGFSSPFPAGVSINHVSVRGNTCYVDLSEELLEYPRSVTIAIKSMICTICALPDISYTVVTIDGVLPSGEQFPGTEYRAPSPNWIL